MVDTPHYNTSNGGKLCLPVIVKVFIIIILVIAEIYW